MDLRYRIAVTSWRIADERGDLLHASTPRFEVAF